MPDKVEDIYERFPDDGRFYFKHYPLIKRGVCPYCGFSQLNISIGIMIRHMTLVHVLKAEEIRNKETEETFRKPRKFGEDTNGN